MSTTHRFIEASPHDVFDVLSDGWLFPSWVVGSARIREVDLTWPSVEATIHHSFGVWPLVIDDVTTILEWDPPVRAVFHAKGWPMGEARVEIDVRNRMGGCFVTMTEYAVAGPGRLVPKPLMDPPLHWRNKEALQRLAWLAEGRVKDRVSPS
ncbi:SRPBCC family protein [Frigoribacterium sp. RIT-PI-h]|uniref:SRPBCC family protein n=1 Tax=unclassified Frigoribacterium TaxID=2627005 RepID=UPI0006B92208|nr:SRPBCC family protein [Frigoribacterium sp. RIT-PI-h]KPG88460.1 polyketide cyclase [Frigoribacterium sp. RIT-PI-h]